MANPASELYQRLVQEELGLVARLDEESGVVMFAVPELGRFFIASPDVTDPEYFRMDFNPIALPEDLRGGRLRILDAINRTQLTYKVIRVVLMPEPSPPTVAISVAAVLGAVDQPPEEAVLRSVFRRYFSLIEGGVRKFLEYLDLGADDDEPSEETL